MSDPDAHLQRATVWTPEVEPGHQAYVVFRRVFTLEATPDRAELRIFADSRYLLWVNGVYIERGPCRFDPRHPEYDTLAIEAHLHAGQNVVAVLVHHYALGTFPDWKSRCSRILDHEPGLAVSLRVEASGGVVTFFSDRRWRCSADTRFQPSPGTYSSIPDVIDARCDTGDWSRADFDPSSTVSRSECASFLGNSAARPPDWRFVVQYFRQDVFFGCLRAYQFLSMRSVIIGGCLCFSGRSRRGRIATSRLSRTTGKAGRFGNAR